MFKCLFDILFIFNSSYISYTSPSPSLHLSPQLKVKFFLIEKFLKPFFAYDITVLCQTLAFTGIILFLLMKISMNITHTVRFITFNTNLSTLSKKKPFNDTIHYYMVILISPMFLDVVKSPEQILIILLCDENKTNSI